MFPALENTAGERERELRSRRANALDALAIACGVLFVLWPLCFGVGVLGRVPVAAAVGKGLMLLGFVWAVVGSPRWHGDTLESRGVSSPWRLARLLREKTGAQRAQIVAVFLLIFGGLVCFSLLDWPDAARFFRLPKPYQVAPDSALKWIAIASGSAFAGWFIASFIVRYDNLRPALALALKISAIFLAYATLAAWLARGPKAFARFELADHSLDMAAHMFWGLIQQFTFTAYFATRLRKAFAPAASPRGPLPIRRHWLFVILGGVIAAATLGPAMWLALRVAHGAQVPASLIASIAAFAFPIGAAWTHFFCRDRRRMLVATLSGSFFGLIHIDSYGLVLLTGILGTTFAYAAMEDRFRNLAAFAFVHGLLGATVLKLFGGKGIFRITLSVGPWAVKTPSAADLAVPLVCLAGYAVIAFFAARKLPVAEPATLPGTAGSAS